MLLRLFVLTVALAGCTASQAANDAASSPTRGAVSYIALGDSFTIGTGASPAQSFPARLASAWACPVDLLNAGVDGFTTDNLIEIELPRLKTAGASFATLLVGANDIVHGESEGVYRAHLRTIFEALAGAHVARVVALPQPDWSKSPVATAFGTPEVLYGKIVLFNQILREEAGAAQREFVDLFPLMESQAIAGMLASDGLHPSAAAYGAWSVELAREVASPCAR